MSFNERKCGMEAFFSPYKKMNTFLNAVVLEVCTTKHWLFDYDFVSERVESTSIYLISSYGEIR